MSPVKPKPFDEYEGDNCWILVFLTKDFSDDNYDVEIWDYYSEADGWWLKHKTDDYFLLIKPFQNPQ